MKTRAFMTDMAVRAENVDGAKAEQARKAAEERLKQKPSDEDFAIVQAALLKSNAQIQVKRRHRV